MGKCIFKKIWLQNSLYSSWIEESSDKYEAKCKFCKESIKLSTMGERSLKYHMNRNKHKGTFSIKQCQNVPQVILFYFTPKCCFFYCIIFIIYMEMIANHALNTRCNHICKITHWNFWGVSCVTLTENFFKIAYIFLNEYIFKSQLLSELHTRMNLPNINTLIILISVVSAWISPKHATCDIWQRKRMPYVTSDRES